MNIDARFDFKAIQEGLKTVYNFMDSEKFFFSVPDAVKFLELDWKMRDEQEYPESEKGLLELDRQLRVNRISLESAIKSAEEENYSFWERWIFLKRPTDFHSELYGRNAVLFGKLLPRTYDTVMLRFEIFNSIVDLIYGSSSSYVKACLSMEKGFSFINYNFIDPGKHHTKALKCFKEALSLIDRKEHPEEWTKIILGMGMFYSKFHSANIQEKSKCYEKGLRYYNAAEKINNSSATSYKPAHFFVSIGNFHLYRLNGNKKNNINKAIDNFNKALRFFRRDLHPISWSDIIMSLGIAYINLGHTKENLWKAIQYLKSAREAVRKEKLPIFHAVIQRHLGVAFLYLRDYEETVNCGMSAVDAVSENKYSFLWARLQQLLGDGLKYSESGNRAANVDASIKCFKKSLSALRKTSHSTQWARTHASLANAYYERINGDKGVNIEKSIRHYKRALEVFSNEAWPVEWSKVLNNLGFVYKDRIHGDRLKNVEYAVHCYKKALSVRKRKTFPVFWATTQFNLAHAYKDRIKGNRAANLEMSLKHYQSALEIFNEDYPFESSAVHHNIGQIYSNRIRGDAEENKREAIKNFKAALEFRKKEKIPMHWALTCYLLGKTYKMNPGKRHKENLEKAVQCFEDALSVLTPESFPGNSRNVFLHLGDIHILRKNYQAALEAYEKAALADDNSNKQLALAVSRDHEIKAGAALYYNSAWCLAKIGRNKDALEWLERGKTRALNQIIALDRAKFEDIRREDKNCYKELSDRLKALEGEQRNPRRNFDEIIEDVLETKKKLDALIERIQKYKPDFLRQSIEFNDMSSLIPDDQTAAVEFNITEHGTVIFFLFKRRGTPCIESVFADEFHLNELKKLCNRWVQRYQQFQERQESDGSPKERQAWGNYMLRFLKNLSDNFFDSAIDHLKELEIKKLIIVPHLALHIFPLNLLSRNVKGNRKYLIEEFDVTFAPSLTILYRNERQQKEPLRNFLGISDLTKNLEWTEEEINRISRLFSDSISFSEMDAEYDEVISGIQNAGYLHFAVHGNFNLQDPYASYLDLTLNYEEPELHDKNDSEGELVSVCYSSRGRKISEVRRTKEGAEQRKYFYKGKLRSSIIKNDGGLLGNNGDWTRKLTLNEIFTNLKMYGNRLVVLSACESGLVEYSEKADEYIGLPAGFLHAGANAVISSLWVVDDEFTCAFMEKFYRKMMIEKMTPAKALRQTQIEARKLNRNPFYWAGFYLTGK